MPRDGVLALVVTAFVLLPHGVGAGGDVFPGDSTKPCEAAAKAAAAAAAGAGGGMWGQPAATGVEAHAATPSPAPCVELRPQYPLLRETIPIGGPSRLYALKGLKRGTPYEVHVSYPASNPADFTIELINPPTGMKLELPPKQQQQRLRSWGGKGDNGGGDAGRKTTGTSTERSIGRTSFSFTSANAPKVAATGTGVASKKVPIVTAKTKIKDSGLRRMLRRLLNVEKMVMMEDDIADGTHQDAGGGIGAAVVGEQSREGWKWERECEWGRGDEEFWGCEWGREDGEVCGREVDFIAQHSLNTFLFHHSPAFFTPFLRRPLTRKTCRSLLWFWVPALRWCASQQRPQGYTATDPPGDPRTPCTT